MPIESWLSDLAQNDHSAVDGDLEALANKPYPFLTDQNSSNQIERLSGHLGGRHQNVRRQVIAYSLYIRQVDAILERGARGYCCGHCPNPPAGCCNRDHFVIMNVTDLMSSHNSPAALHMAHMIGQLQKLESTHNLAAERTIRPGYCSLLAHDGCTLRLFKSPRCAHYICEDLQASMQKDSEGKAGALLAALKYTESSVISSPADYANQDVIDQAELLFADDAPRA
ncbi:hypothetical protein [Humidesulfovibrio idahonensis]